MNNYSDMRKLETFLNEYRTHPRKIYYIRHNPDNITIASHPNKKNGGYTRFYTVDGKHADIVPLMKKLENNLEKYETDFSSYFTAAIHSLHTASPNAITSDALSHIISDVQSLHPFFRTSPDNTLYYIQEHIITYYQKNFEYYIYSLLSVADRNCPEESLTEQIFRAAEEQFRHLLFPIISYTDRKKKPLEETQKKVSSLWFSFMDSLKERSGDNSHKPIKSIVRRYQTTPASAAPEHRPYFLYSLSCLLHILKYYIEQFPKHIRNAPFLSATQFFCIFWSHSNPIVMEKALKEQKVISAYPDELYTLLTSGFSRERGSDGHIFDYIDDPDNIFDRRTNQAYQKLTDLPPAPESDASREELVSIRSAFDQYIPPQNDAVLRSEIHEFYYFEQLIYMEVMDMVQRKYFARQCFRSGCGQYFMANTRKRKYCDKCSASRSASDQTYRNSMSELEAVKQKYYHRRYYQIGKLQDPREQNSARASLRKKDHEVRQLLEKYNQEGTAISKTDFEQEVRNIYNQD